MTTIFLSSVIGGMEDMRAAAEAACDALSIRVIKAENFTAHAGSPRAACLQGVASADGVVLLLGTRYGDEQPSGKSATEEEFGEAVRLRKDVFVFRTSEHLDDAQVAFLDRIGKWQGGHLYRSCATPIELQRDVAKALMAWSSAPAEEEIDEEVRKNLAAVTPRTERGFVSQTGPWLSVSWSPCQRLVLDDEFVFETLPEIIADRLVAGPARLLSVRPDTTAQEHGLSVRSRNNERPELRAWIGTDGSVAVGVEIAQPEPDRSWSPASSFFLAPKDLERTMGRAFAFLGSVIEETDRDRRCTSGRMQASLSRMDMRTLGDPPAQQGGFQIGMPGERDRDQPITVPSAPFVVVRSQLSSGSPEVGKLVKKLQRILGPRDQ